MEKEVGGGAGGGGGVSALRNGSGKRPAHPRGDPERVSAWRDRAPVLSIN